MTRGGPGAYGHLRKAALERCRTRLASIFSDMAAHGLIGADEQEAFISGMFDLDEETLRCAMINLVDLVSGVEERPRQRPALRLVHKAVADASTGGTRNEVDVPF